MIAGHRTREHSSVCPASKAGRLPGTPQRFPLGRIGRWAHFQSVNHYSDDHNNLLDDAMTMTCHELASRIEELQTDAMPRDVARLCLLLANFVDDIGDLEDESSLSRAWQEMGIRLQAATDQHAAMTEDLEELSRRDPAKFTIDQVWTLIRAIKVQSQILQLYVGQPTADV